MPKMKLGDLFTAPVLLSLFKDDSQEPYVFAFPVQSQDTPGSPRPLKIPRDQISNVIPQFKLRDNVIVSGTGKRATIVGVNLDAFWLQFSDGTYGTALVQHLERQ